jgi:ribosome-binding factor A
MADYKEAKTENHIRELAAAFLQHKSNGMSLLTVTRVTLANRMTRAIIYFTVLPEDKEQEALEFVQRKRYDFKEYVKKHAKLGRIPLFDFEIDKGEKNRQKIDEISTKLEDKKL